MAIKNNQTIDGIDIDKCKSGSKKRVIKLCDVCKSENDVTLYDLHKCRKHWLKRTDAKDSAYLDFCHACSMKIKNLGDNNPAKSKKSRLAISHATKGRTKTFKDGINLRILPIKVSVNGYILEFDKNKNKHIPQHRLKVSRHINRDLTNLEVIHHIDGDKKNNNIGNLFLCPTVRDHSMAHDNLQKIAFDCVKNGIIKFSKSSGQYYIDPTLDLQKLTISLGFDDIAIKQNKNICQSRLDVNISSEIIRGIYRPIPLVGANMSTVMSVDFYIKLYELGAFGIMHRAWSNQDDYIQEMYNISKSCDLVAASVGIDNNAFDLAKRLIKEGNVNIINIDIAHGYNDTVIELAKKIKRYCGDVKIILGNVSNTDIIYEIYKFIDCLKLGIGQGLACETKNTAGCTEKQFSCVYKFKNLARDFGIPIMSDGSVRESGDFTKAIGAGANSVMIGSVLASCPESAAEIVEVDGVKKKLYAGMASRYVQEKWRGGLKSGTCSEGKVVYLDIKRPVAELIERYAGALRSGITYAGATTIKDFQDKVKFVRIN